MNRSIDRTLAGIANRALGVETGYRFSGHRSLCHLAVADAIRERGAVDDKVWLFGFAGLVTHSVLTDKNNRVIVDTSKGRLKDGVYTETSPAANGPLVLDTLVVVFVSDIYDQFF